MVGSLGWHVWRSGAVPLDWQTRVMVPIFEEGDVITMGELHSSASPGKSMPACWKGESVC